MPASLEKCAFFGEYLAMDIRSLLPECQTAGCIYILIIPLCGNGRWMVGVDRGNPPAKGSTTYCQSAKHRCPVWEMTGQPSVSYQQLTMQAAVIWACGLPYIYDCWCLGRAYDMNSASLITGHNWTEPDMCMCQLRAHVGCRPNVPCGPTALDHLSDSAITMFTHATRWPDKPLHISDTVTRYQLKLYTVRLATVMCVMRSFLNKMLQGL